MKKPSVRPRLESNRKTLRKQKRQQKKIQRQEHYMKKNVEKHTAQNEYDLGRFVRRPTEPPKTNKAKKKNSQTVEFQTPLDILSKERLKETKEAEKLKTEIEERRKKMLLKANEDEDKIIKKLEKQLGLNKRKNKTKHFGDGLDYLLEICDGSTSEQIVAAERHLAQVDDESDFEEDLAVVAGKNRKYTSKKYKKKEKNTTDHSDLEYSEPDFSGDDEIEGSGEDDISDEHGVDEDMSVEENDNSEDDDNSEEGDNSDDASIEKPKKTQKTVTKPQPTKQYDKNTKINTTNSKIEKIISENDLSKVFSDDEVSHLSDDDMLSENGDENNTKNKQEKPDVWEDIYGRKRDKEGNIIKEEKGVYIAPHLRNRDSSSDKLLVQLKRQIKSVLNKLAGTNLHWACSSIESLYSSNSRHSVSSSLVRLWQDACVLPSAAPHRLVSEHAALVAVLHANVGEEIGAHFLQELCKRFHELMQSVQPVEDKTLDNLVSCLANLYNFKVCHASLMYDILARLVENISEKNIECVLVALRTVGGVLRKEEPLALRNFIHDTQTRVATLNEASADGTRIKFLVDVLMAVKNNNLMKIPNYDPSYSEHLKKITKTIIRKGNYITPLNIRLQDLLKADERGRWWVVGSAWDGNIPPQEDKSTVKVIPNNDHKLLELARKQRMNTDVRRSIFCVIMSAEDYMDAFEKLQHLGLKGSQERETVHVLLACCLQEKSYNHYYALLGQRLCDFDRKYQLSIQYSVWDKIKELDSMRRQSGSNLAQFLTHLIMEGGLPLSVLKVIRFSDLNKHSVRFMRQILLAIIMNVDLEASLQVFYRIARPPKLHMFRESLRLFIQHFLIKNLGKTSKVLIEADTVKLKQRAVDVDKILTSHESRIQF